MADAGAEGAETVRQALRRTLESQTARFEFQMRFRPLGIGRRRSRDSGALLGQLAKAVATAAQSVVGAAVRSVVRRWSLSAEGVIDLAGRRLMMDFGSYAVLVAEGRRWSGRSGRAIATLPADTFSPSIQDPFWLLDLLKGVSEAQLDGSETLRERHCRRFSASADLTRAAELSPDDLALPPAKRYGDLLAVPLQVWIDEDGRILRVLSESEMMELSIVLAEYGVELPADWSRLPTFRSPEKAKG